MKKLKKYLSFVLLVALSITFGVPNVYAEENVKGNGNVSFENVVSEKDKAYVKKRNQLIAKYGVEKAYEMLDSKLIKTTEITMNSLIPGTSLYSVTPPVEDDFQLFTSKSKNCGWYYGENSTVATIKISVYKNFTDNVIDFVYDVDYNDPSFNAGYGSFDDVMAANFDDSDVYWYDTYKSSTLNNYVPNSAGGGGFITDNSNYAYIIHATKPRSISGLNIDTVHGKAWMHFGNKYKGMFENISFTLAYGSVAISYPTFSYFKDYYLELSW